MKFDDERELEDVLFKSITDGCCMCRDETYDYIFRQFEIKGYGVIDILGVTVFDDMDRVKVEIHIYELKNVRIDHFAVMQIAKYKQGIERYIENQFMTKSCRKNRVEIEVVGHLVGLGYSGTTDICYLIDSIPWLDCFECEIINGVVTFAESSGWMDKRENFRWKNSRLNALISRVLIEYKSTMRTRIHLAKQGSIRNA